MDLDNSKKICICVYCGAYVKTECFATVAKGKF